MDEPSAVAKLLAFALFYKVAIHAANSVADRAEKQERRVVYPEMDDP